MARIRIPCLVGKRNKAGVTSWYWQPSATLARAGWKPMALGKDEGAAIAAARKRNQEIEDWKLGGEKPREVKRRVQQGTLGALIARYRQDVLEGKHPGTGRPLLRPQTKGLYETGLKRLEAWAGQHPVAYVTPARVRALRDATVRPRDAKNPEKGGLGHAAAFNLLKLGRQLFAYAERVDVTPRGSNPFARFDLGAPSPRCQVWEAEDEAAFIAAAYDLGLPSMALAIEIAVYSGQREADLIAFTEPQLQPIEIHDPTVRARFADAAGQVMGWVLAQGKTSDEHTGQRVQLEIPFEPGLRAKVERAIAANRARDRAAEPRRLLTHVVVDDKNGGRPWKKRDFIDAYRAIIAHAAKATGRAQMLGLVWHDLRRTRVVRLRRRGVNPAMIASITGHSPQSINMMLKVYGPVDPTVTAAALAASLDPLPAPPAADEAGKAENA
jgi:hypothetical protein